MGQRFDSMVRDPRRTVFLLFYFVLAFLTMTQRAQSEFFRYVDKDGRVHYVDDMSRIPPEYREELKAYREQYDHLSESEKAILREKERRKAEERRQKIDAILKQPRQAEDNDSNDVATKVLIKGNHVLVPVQLGFGRKRTTAMLVLDTGAEIMVLHENVAAKLNIRSSQKAAVKVAGGQRVPVKLVKLSYVQAGPHRKTDVRAVVMAPQGSVHYEGLLGMNFLKDLDYRIDFENQVIQWRP
jgi:clan AA aspartic protease (TIGR02281 family)